MIKVLQGCVEIAFLANFNKFYSQALIIKASLDSFVVIFEKRPGLAVYTEKKLHTMSGLEKKQEVYHSICVEGDLPERHTVMILSHIYAYI